MNWQLISRGLLIASLTAFGFGVFNVGMLARSSFCDVFGGTWLGYWCREDIHHILPEAYL